MRKVLIVAILVLLLGLVIMQTNLFRYSNSPTPQKVSIYPSPSPQQKTQLQTVCTGIPTPEQTEGPYYKTGSPQRNDIAQEISGERLVVSGFVYDKNCKAIPNAWLDFWQADSNGVYDNVEYKLRGHQFTNENGIYRLETIVPAEYESRPPHIHVKVQAPNKPISTFQMYFPGEKQDPTGSIFNRALLMNMMEGTDNKIAEFNFVLNE